MTPLSNNMNAEHANYLLSGMLTAAMKLDLLSLSRSSNNNHEYK
jgi:hypothetical protein